jgi:hypothetical protein
MKVNSTPDVHIRHHTHQPDQLFRHILSRTHESTLFTIHQRHAVRMSNTPTHIHQKLIQHQHPVIHILVLKPRHQLTQTRSSVKVDPVDITVLIVHLPLAVDLEVTAIAQHPQDVCHMERPIDTHTSVSKFFLL